MPNGTYGGVRGGLNSPYSIMCIAERSRVQTAEDFSKYGFRRECDFREYGFREYEFREYNFE